MNDFTSHPLPSRMASKRKGFTLIELLVVIAIIGILAAMLLPVLAVTKKKAQAGKAKQEIGQIVMAISAYESTYSRPPISPAALKAAGAAQPAQDITFGFQGTVVAVTNTALLNLNNAVGVNYDTNNSEIIAILMDRESYPEDPGKLTVNREHARNPQRQVFLNVSTTSDKRQGGVGPDLVYRDPWGNPYIISVDANFDDKTCDAFYRYTSIATLNNTPLFGLFLEQGANADTYRTGGKIMVWSAGPDKLADRSIPANQGVNKDNILSWKP